MKLFGLDEQPRKRRATDRRRCAAFGLWIGAATPRRQVVEKEQGFALLAVLLLLMLALTLGAGTLLYTLLDLKSAQHYETGNQAFAAAEAGLLDVINTIDTRGVVNFKTDVIDSHIISTLSTAVSGFPNVTYQVTGLVSGTDPATTGVVTVTGNALLSAQRVIQVNVKRGDFVAGPGALHLSNDSAVGSFSGNSMTIDGNNWLVTDLTPTAVLDQTWPARPAISTRNDTVTTQIVTALAGQGTITGLESTPSVMTTAAASTADANRFINDILTANGAPSGCNQNNNKDYPVGNVICVPQTQGHKGNAESWGTMTNPQVTYVTDPNAKIAGGSVTSTGAGILIFGSNTIQFNGGFVFCGWVLFQNPNPNGGISVGGNPSIYGTVWSPLNAFDSNGNITIKYSHNCLGEADSAGSGGGNNLPHPLQITSWSEP
ncbi:MAG TPA: hypothetical protein VF515_07410 [Candidatus Binatia bacterium]